MRVGRFVLLTLFVIGCATQEPILLEEGGSRINELMLNVRMSPGDPESRVLLGMAYAEEDQLRMAVAWFDSALSIRPEYPHALFEKGRTLCRSGLEREGKKLINQAIRQPGGDQHAAQLGRELPRHLPARNQDDAHGEPGMLSGPGGRITPAARARAPRPRAACDRGPVCGLFRAPPWRLWSRRRRS